MNLTVSRLVAPVAMGLALPLLAVSAAADEPESKAETQAESDEKAKPAPIVIPEIKEEKRICRKVKLDMSSRRGSRVCKTAEEWRVFNQRR